MTQDAEQVTAVPAEGLDEQHHIEQLLHMWVRPKACFLDFFVFKGFYGFRVLRILNQNPVSSYRSIQEIWALSLGIGSPTARNASLTPKPSPNCEQAHAAAQATEPRKFAKISNRSPNARQKSSLQLQPNEQPVSSTSLRGMLPGLLRKPCTALCPCSLAKSQQTLPSAHTSILWQHLRSWLEENLIIHG